LFGRWPSRLWKLMPRYFQRVEKKILWQADTILTSCSTLGDDLRDLVPESKIVQVEDVPIQPTFPGRTIERENFLERFSGPTSAVVVCCIMQGNRLGMRKLLMAVRKVVEAIPSASFFFKGVLPAEAKSMATNLDIFDRCSFLAPDDAEDFVAALDFADVTLLVPEVETRYMHPEVFTLLYSPAPLIVVQEGDYASVLTEANSVSVLSSAESIAEGLLRVIREPLLSMGIATEGQQLIADHYSYSSFKHKIRMVYHEVLRKE
ncbi:MAG: hypothetical protein OES84_02075, partial [Kiritimatiellaceae bacterium]|nr:hypothetical protein [Kiritimatiellaceae bacterium]